MYSRESSHNRVKGEVLDMYDALAAEDIESVLTASSNLEDISDSKIVLITSGVPRQPGYTRLDLAVPNAEIIK